MKNQNGLAPIIILIILILVIGGGIFTWQYLKAPEEEAKTPPTTEGISPGETQPTETPKKCEFPDTLNGYTKQQVNDIGALATQEQKEASGLVSSIMVSYSGFNMISLTVFATEDRAKAQLTLASSQGYKDCEIENVKGLCRSETPSGSIPPQFQKSIVWREGKIVKTITNTEQKLTNESTADLEKRVEGKLELFVSSFKNCEVGP